MNESISIRPVSTRTDFPAIVRLANLVEPYPIDEERVRELYRYTPPQRIQAHLAAADANDALIGYASLLHEATAAEGEFSACLVVDPARRCQGIGGALWQGCLEALKELGAQRVTAAAPEADRDVRRFLERCGFSEQRRTASAALDLAGFDETPFQEGFARLAARGIRFAALAEFPDTLQTRYHHWNLLATNEQDLPHPTPLKTPFPLFEEMVLNAPGYRRESHLLALDGEHWIGLAAVRLSAQSSAGPRTADLWHTGVLREYRGQGLGLALHVVAARHAAQQGARQLISETDADNTPLLAIQRRMGFQPRPGKVYMQRTLERGD